MADHLEGLVTTGAIASARLTVNRRQTDPADREALGLLRQGDATGSQSLRAENGWEHEHKSPAEAREAMAQAVCDDIGRYGAGQVVALVVSHADAEDIADRVRDRLASAGQLGGPVVTGPGWTGEREYQAGDRVLLHARCGPSASSLVNGTAATVTRVDGEGLEVRLDGRGTMASLPTAFVQGTRKDGSPNLSHAWARTVDGAQGGTWEAAHLLGNSALDAYRGYTGQSRSRQPAHTWNTARVAPADHGGGLADRRSPAELVAQALARQADPTLAARSDPWVLDRRLREQIAEHERVLAARPPDRREALAEATRELEMAQGWWANMEAVATETARQLGAMSQFAGLSPRGRAERRRLQDKLACDTVRAGAAKESCDELETQAGRLRKEQGALERFEAAEGWRRDEVPRLQDQLDHHWAEVVAACVNADDPLAFGTDKLRHARATVALDLQRLADAAPPDREGEREQARQELGDTLRARHDAEAAVAAGRAELADASRRRWGRRHREAVAAAQSRLRVAEQRLGEDVAAENAVRDRLAAVARYQEERKEAVAGAAPRRRELGTALAQFDAALDRTRPDRALALVDGPPPHLVETLGQPPRSAAGRAVWCHHALGIEAALDGNDAERPARTVWSLPARVVREQVAVADRWLETAAAPGPAEWAALASEAAGLCEHLQRSARARQVAQQVLTARAGHPQWGLGTDGWAVEQGQGPSL